MELPGRARSCLALNTEIPQTNRASAGEMSKWGQRSGILRAWLCSRGNMLRSKFAASLILITAAFAQETAIDRSSVWIDKVNRGNLPVKIRGRGVLAQDQTAEIKIPENLAGSVQQGQQAWIRLGPDTASSKVARIGGPVSRKQTLVILRIEDALPAGAQPGMEVDGTIDITTLNDVVFVGRPVTSLPDSEGTIFKLEPDGNHATRVKVTYGHATVNGVEIRQGLEAGDRVILSDMSAYEGQDKLRLTSR